MNKRRTSNANKCCGTMDADLFASLIEEMRSIRPRELSFEHVARVFNNDGLAREIMILFDPGTDYKTAKLDYYYKQSANGGWVISPKVYPTRAIGKILKYVSQNKVVYITRRGIKEALNMRYYKAWASLLCLLYLGLLQLIPDTTAECTPTDKQSEFCFYSLPTHVSCAKIPRL